MVVEVLRLFIKPGMESEFEATAASRGVPILKRATGCTGFDLTRSHENPSNYILFLTWETLENHIVDWRASPLRDEWLALMRPFYAQRPEGEHVNRVLKAF